MILGTKHNTNSEYIIRFDFQYKNFNAYQDFIKFKRLIGQLINLL